DVRAPPKPSWQSFFVAEPGDGQGELLVGVQIIRKPNKEARLPPPPSIVPDFKQAYLEVVALGIRDMKPFNFMPIHLPYCVLEVDSENGTKKTVQTDPSKQPSGANANFLQ
ncbi:unnamed protein product, partial [Discosporangium mesarthrocarpum]